MFGNSWDELLEAELKKEYFRNLIKFLDDEYGKYEVFPPRNEIFRAFKITDYEKVKVVILGQDPYHGKGQADGLAFSVQNGNKLPPSLINIFKEMADDIYHANITVKSGDLTHWAEQGVLLLNTVLTVRSGEAGSHKDKGWEIFTSKVIELLANSENPTVFILWGKNAMSKAKYIDKDKHLVFMAPHPSPLSCYRGFFGGKYFSKANDFLVSHGLEPIDWNI